MAWLVRTLKRSARSARNDELRQRWERRAEPVLLILAVAMIPLIVGHFDRNLPDSAQMWLFVGDAVIWTVFGIDLAVRVWLAEHRRHFIVNHWYEFLIVAIPFFRPLRVLLLLRLVVVLKVFSEMLRRRAIGVSLLASLLAIALATTVVVLVEQSGEGAIDSWGTALWWAVATITTVGYGDVTPVTAVGRAVGVLLMVVGIGVFGVLTANVAAWFVEGQKSEASPEAAELRRLQAENETLRAEIQSLRPDEGPDC